MREGTVYLLDHAVFFMLLVLIPLAAIPYGAVEEWWEAVFECAVFALAAMWIVESALSGKWFVREHRLLVPLLALLVFLFLQTIPFSKVNIQGVEVWRALSGDPYETRLVAFRFLTLIIVAALLLRYTSSRKRLRALIYVVISTGVASALFGIVRQTTQGDASGFLLSHLEPGRGYGQFINYNHFAFLMEMTLGLLSGLIIGGGIHRHRRRLVMYWRLIIYAGAFVLAWTALVLSNSRGGIFGMLSQTFFLVLLLGAVKAPQALHKHRSRMSGRLQRIGRALAFRVILIAFLMLVMVYGLAMVGGEPLAHRMEKLSIEVSQDTLDERAGTRLNFWTATWKLIKAHPAAGTGFGSYWIAIDRHYEASGNSTPQQAHNDYLELLAAGGIIGAALVAWFVVLFIRRAREVLHDESSFRRAACFGALGGIFAIAVHSAVEFGLHATTNALVFTSLVVIATVNYRDEGTQPDDPHQRHYLLTSSFHPSFRASFGRLAVVTACLAAGVLCVWTAARVGLSRLHSDDAAEDRLLAQANYAVHMTPSDPVAHFVRAGVLLEDKQVAGALEEYERAVALRPGDHVLWLNLGFARERNGDEQGALADFEEAVRLAPYYSMPRWQLGNSLLRMGQRELAFAEFRRAVASDPELLPQAADLVWEESGGDPNTVQQAVRPETTSAKVALARYFSQRGVLKETIELFRQAGSAANEERLALLKKLVTEKKFIEAYEVWAIGRAEGRDRGGVGAITNGGFEDDIDLNDQGFGWRQLAPDVKAVRVSLDANDRRAGSHSLHLEFGGNPDSSISQLVLVEAGTNYRLSFAARTLAIVTGGLPVITVTDGNNAGQVLGQTGPLPPNSGGWQDYGVEFATTGTTSAVMIEIRQQHCASMPCPIFGHLWLDNFLLQKNIR